MSYFCFHDGPSSYLNFNKAPLQSTYGLIPEGTLAKASMTIIKGGVGDDEWLTQNKDSGALYLNAVFTIEDGPYAGKHIKHAIGIRSACQPLDDVDVWAAQGHAMLRAIVESARNIHPLDGSLKAIDGRYVSHLEELQGILCIIAIGINAGTGNTIGSIITPDSADYNLLMGRDACLLIGAPKELQPSLNPHKR